MLGSRLKVPFYLNDKVNTKRSKIMTQHKEDTIIRSVFEIINENSIEGIGEAVSILINEAMKVERSSVLNVRP